MDIVTLQIPMSKSLRNEATEVARDYGFSSLQEIIRVILVKLASKQLAIRVEEPAVKLSKAAIKRYDKMYEDFKKGKNVFTAHSVEELMEDLHS
jgi:antitoxin component of RelBE/YafQ-DinJ toxin-antitoxin module